MSRGYIFDIEGFNPHALAAQPPAPATASLDDVARALNHFREVLSNNGLWSGVCADENRAAHAALRRAAGTECPIGVGKADDPLSRSICSAGTCVACLHDRIEHYSRAAGAVTDEMVEAALEAWFEEINVSETDQALAKSMRRALTAAAQARAK